MEEDIQNYSPTVMFHGTPCTKNKLSRKLFFFEFLPFKTLNSVEMVLSSIKGLILSRKYETSISKTS